MIGLSDKNLKPIWALEIKWSNRYFEKPSELKSLVTFCKKCNLKTALITSIDKEGVIEYDGIKLHFIPAASYAYTVGKNTMQLKMLK